MGETSDDGRRQYAPPTKPERGASPSRLRRLGVWLGLVGIVTLAALNIATTDRDLTPLGYSGLGAVLSVWALAVLGVLGGAVLIVIGWVRSARKKGEESLERRKVIEWVVVVLASVPATLFIIVLIAWATSDGR